MGRLYSVPSVSVAEVGAELCAVVIRERLSQ